MLTRLPGKALPDLLAALFGALLVEFTARVVARGAESELSPRAQLTLLAAQLAAQLMGALAFALARTIAGGGTRLAHMGALAVGAVLGAAGLVPVGRALTTGAWISRKVWAPWLNLGIVSVGSLAIAATLAYWPRIADANRRVKTLLCGLMLMSGLLATWANVTQFASLYREAHLALFAYAALSAQLALWVPARALAMRMPPLRSTALAALLILVCLVGFLRPPVSVAAELLMHAERAGYLMRVLLPPYPSHALAQRLARVNLHEPLLDDTGALPRGLTVPSNWNVVLVVVDTMRADALPGAKLSPGRRRFGPRTAPFLFRLTKRSQRFTRAYAGAVWTGFSMPSLLGSSQGFEGDSGRNPAIAWRMAALGRHPVAVVPDFFMHSWAGRPELTRGWRDIPALLDGMAEVEVYRETQQDEQRKLTADLLGRVSDRPFFAWLHYFGMHAPGWVGKAPPSWAHGWPTAYRESLGWIDAQLADLFALLRRQGIAERTIVVVTADHGEGLGDHGVMFHGPAVWEQVARVPLMFYVPGQRAARYDLSVGNIDIVPTLLELLGGRPSPADQGVSLAPLLTGSTALPPARGYYIFDGMDERVALVKRNHKYLYDIPTGISLRFDVAKDPMERVNRYNPSDRIDRDLQQLLAELRPEVFRRELQQPAIQRLLDAKLSQMTPRQPPRDLPFLAKLIALSPTPGRLDWAAQFFAQTASDEARLVLAKELYASDPTRLTRAIDAYLRQLVARGAAPAFVEQLATLKLPPFSTAWVAEQLHSASSQGEAQWSPWLKLVEGWPLDASTDTAALANILSELTGPQAHSDPGTMRLALGAVSRLSANAGMQTRLFEIVRPLTTSANVAVRAAALVALGHVGDARAEALLRAQLDDGPVAVRLRALDGLVALKGEGAISDLERLGKQADFIEHATFLVGSVGSPKGLRFLDWIESVNVGDAIKYEARLARDKIEQKQAKHGRDERHASGKRASPAP